MFREIFKIGGYEVLFLVSVHLYSPDTVDAMVLIKYELWYALPLTVFSIIVSVNAFFLCF